MPENSKKYSKTNNKRNIAAAVGLLCVVLLAVMAFSVLFIAKEADHTCTGENCPICLEIRACVQTLKTIGSAVGAHLALAVTLFCTALTVAVAKLAYAAVDTLVSLKVKLSD